MCSFRVRLAHLVSFIAGADYHHSVMSVKGKKVLHIDRNDHYGGFVGLVTSSEASAYCIQ